MHSNAFWFSSLAIVCNCEGCPRGTHQFGPSITNWHYASVPIHDESAFFFLNSHKNIQYKLDGLKSPVSRYPDTLFVYVLVFFLRRANHDKKLLAKHLGESPQNSWDFFNQQREKMQRAVYNHFKSVVGQSNNFVYQSEWNDSLVVFEAFIEMHQSN